MEPVTQRQRKLTALGLLIVSVVIVVFSIYSTNTNLRATLLAGRDQEQTIITDPQEQINEELRTLDTDKDGLNDYDELYLYSTSPYLVDSDSDGVSDDEEIASGKDPNCPGSQDCYNAIITPLGKDSFTDTPEPDFSNFQFSGGTNDQLKEVFPINPTPSEIRLLLIQQGVPEADVSSISDEDLITIYNDAYNAL